jgi:N-acetyltransferase
VLIPRSPKPLPTNLGIHRLFTVPSYRGHNLAQALLDTACKHTIYGLPLSPGSGQIAFSQPTDSGRRMMERWGGGAVRVFVDDESQL